MIENFINIAPTIGTIGFFLAFCYVIYYTFNKSNKKKFDESAKIPFDDGKK